MKKWEAVAREQVPDVQKTFKGPVKVHISAYFERPLCHLKRRAAGLRSTAPQEHIQKPDGDNIAKFVGDCLTGLAYHDDCQICDLRVTKNWTLHHPRIDVNIEYVL